MPKSLADLKASPDVGRPERTHQLCVAGKLLPELQAADRDLMEAREARDNARAEAERRRDGAAARPARLGTGSSLRGLEEAAEAAASRSDAIRARMAEHLVDVHLVAEDPQDWRNWTLEHPARDLDEDPAGGARDARFAGAACNVDELIAELHEFVDRIDIDGPTGEVWAFVRGNVAPGDLTILASQVVQLNERTVDLGKSRAAWLDTPRSEPA